MFSGPMESENLQVFILVHFLAANRYPLRLKTLQKCFRHFLFSFQMRVGCRGPGAKIC
jgi:hypothetical protein